MRPTVLFVCVSNAGKSQMAQALAEKAAGERVEVHSAGTHPKGAVNALSAEAVAAVGGDMAANRSKGIDPDLLRRADRVIVLGRDAQVEPVEGMRGPIERWVTDEPSERGIDGLERMRLIRDDIDRRVQTLIAELTNRG